MATSPATPTTRRPTPAVPATVWWLLVRFAWAQRGVMRPAHVWPAWFVRLAWVTLGTVYLAAAMAVALSLGGLILVTPHDPETMFINGLVLWTVLLTNMWLAGGIMPPV